MRLICVGIMLLSVTISCRPSTTPSVARPIPEDRVYSRNEVDVPVVPIMVPTPEYPKALAEMRLPGYVRLRFVVGRDGRAERSTIEIVEITNDALGRAAIRAIREAQFNPAAKDGHRVRALVEQVVHFRVRDSGHVAGGAA